ncbi:MAG TPA: nitrous oxide reductase accessory protein NosL [Roseateles sp.]
MPNRRQAWRRIALAGATPLLGGGLTLLLQGSQGRAAVAVPDDVCIVAPLMGWEGPAGPAMLAPRDIPAQARCPVCGMFPARQPRWAAQAIHADGAVHFLDSPLSLFLYLQRVERYAPGRQRSGIAALHVRDHETGRWLPAQQALFVHGSALSGPMKAGNLPAAADAAAAGRLIARHGGQALAYTTLAEELPPALQQLAPHRH